MKTIISTILPDEIDIFNQNKNKMFLTKENALNAYFIRSQENKKLFLHPFEDPKTKEPDYRLREGTTGAAIWPRKKAKRMAKSAIKPKLEIVRVKDVLDLKDSPPSNSFEVSKYDLIGWKAQTLKTLQKVVELSLGKVEGFEFDLKKINDLLIEVIHIKSQIPKDINDDNLF